MVIASNLGFPRIGYRRELKKALENYWAGRSNLEELDTVGRQIRKHSWQLQRDMGIEHIPCNDFSFYDHVLDTSAMVGAVPTRFGDADGIVDLDTYFLMARGATSPNRFAKNGKCENPPRPMEMTKWFNTNYHYIVPELHEHQKFRLDSTKCVDEFKEALGLGILTRPVLLGPVSFLELSKSAVSDMQYGTMLSGLLEIYCEVVRQLEDAGAEWVQLDEPCLSTDLPPRAIAALRQSYAELAAPRSELKLLLASYFGPLGANRSAALSLEVDALHLDFVAGISEVDLVLDAIPSTMSLSAGVVDGHNVWRSNLKESIDLLQRIADRIGPERLLVAPSCSLLHVPIDVEQETAINPEMRLWLAFAKQKLHEISLLTDGLCVGLKEIEPALRESDEVFKQRRTSVETNNKLVEDRLNAVTEDMCNRKGAYNKRRKQQTARFHLPLLPTTTIGSFPQTNDVRLARRDLRAGRLTPAEYDAQMRQAIAQCLEVQEKLGIDLLVHGEPERNDMVEFFAEQLHGITVTEHGWVQSYGSRYVKPPIIFGDVQRTAPLTVDQSVFAQSLTQRPVKGMLTGPVTMLQWSFVRDDQPPSVTCLQLALAIRDEVMDLERHGIGIIQIDEPAIREGLPLKKSDWPGYLDWSVRAFKLAASGVSDETQIHTHMCYSEFNDIIDAVIALDADVISIEAARSSMDLLETLRTNTYPNEIGPGVYDIHSPIVPSATEMAELIRKALTAIPAERLWINPDCGLKTRKWEEVVPALEAMVQAATVVRNELVKLASIQQS